VATGARESRGATGSGAAEKIIKKKTRLILRCLPH
jgi:hypothetical protein